MTARAPAGRDRRMQALVAVVLGLALLAYLPALGGDFFGDDGFYVVDNEALRRIPLWRPWEIFSVRTNPYEYLPLRDLSLRIDMALFGLEPLGYKLHNLVLYGLSCVAAWLALDAVLEARRRQDGSLASGPDQAVVALAVALFAVHPAHVEAVAWIAGRKDLLAALFTFLALWAFARALAPPRPALAGTTLAGCLYAAALLSKAAATPLPAVAFVLAVALAPGPWRQRLGRAALATAPMAVAALVLLPPYLITAGDTGIRLPVDEAAAVGIGERLGLALRILGMLTRIALAPAQLRLIYDLDAPGVAALSYALGAGAVAAALVGTWALVARRALVGLGAAWFVVFLLPYLQLVPFRTWSLASERFVLLPSLGLCLAVAAVALRAGTRRALPVGGVVIVAALAVTFERSRDWAANDTLLAGAAQHAPAKFNAQKALVQDVLLPARRFTEARAAAERVRDATARRFLVAYVDAARAVDGGDATAAVANLRYLLGDGLAAAGAFINARDVHPLADWAYAYGFYREAESLYRQIVARQSGASPVQASLALALVKQGRHAEAIAAFRAALAGGRLSPEQAAATWNNLALAHKAVGDLAAAEEAFRRAVATSPGEWHAAYNLGRLLLDRGDPGAAVVALRQARARAESAGAATTAIDAALAVAGRN